MYDSRIRNDSIYRELGSRLLGIDSIKTLDKSREGNSMTVWFKVVTPKSSLTSTSIVNSDYSGSIMPTDSMNKLVETDLKHENEALTKITDEMMMERKYLHREKFMKSEKLNSRYKASISAVFTATMLVWCYSNSLHSDAVYWNQFMHASTGNKSNVKEYVDVMYQNLPGVLGVANLGTQLESIVERIKPDVMFVGEADGGNIKAACPEGYNWVRGGLKNKIEIIRVSALVRENVPFKTFRINTKTGCGDQNWGVETNGYL